jgi:hypothetical protein
MPISAVIYGIIERINMWMSLEAEVQSKSSGRNKKFDTNPIIVHLSKTS